MKLEGGTLIIFILFFVIICCSALFSTIGYVSTECPECEECECKSNRKINIDYVPINCSQDTKECGVNTIALSAKMKGTLESIKIKLPTNLTNEELIEAYSKYRKSNPDYLDKFTPAKITNV